MEGVKEVRLVWAPHRAVVPPNSEPSVQLAPGPPGTGLPGADKGLGGASSSRSQSTADRSPAGSRSTGAKLPRTVLLGLVPEGTGLPRTNTLDTVPAGAGDPRVWVKLRPVPMGTVNWALGSGNSSSRKEVASDKKPSGAGAGSESQSTADSQGAASSGNWTTTDKSRTSSAETSPADPSGVEVTVNTSPAGAGSTHNRCAAARHDGLSLWGDLAGAEQMPSASTVTASDGS